MYKRIVKSLSVVGKYVILWSSDEAPNFFWIFIPYLYFYLHFWLIYILYGERFSGSGQGYFKYVKIYTSKEFEEIVENDKLYRD